MSEAGLLAPRATAQNFFKEIADAGEHGRQETALAIVKRFREAKRPVPGYGHPDHKNGDPRVARLVEIANGLGVEGRYIEAMNLLGETINKVTGRNLVINASAAIGAVLAEVGIPIGIMRGLVIVVAGSRRSRPHTGGNGSTRISLRLGLDQGQRAIPGRLGRQSCPYSRYGYCWWLRQSHWWGT